MRDGDLLDLQEEAEWVLERLTSIPDSDNKYGKMIHAPDTRSKVLKVIKMFRCEMLDIPMIVKYRRYEYAVELDEDAIWHIFNLDQEYGKFQRSKAQVNEFLLRVMKHDAKIKSYIDELTFAKSQSELNNFNALIRYLRYQFNDQLIDNQDEIVKRKQPQSRDEISIARANRIHELSRLCFLECGQF
jgi:transcriptional accessory protein Tex/SPT6